MRRKEFLEKLSANDSLDDLGLIQKITKEDEHKAVSTNPIDKDWKERLKNNWWATDYSGNVKELRKEIKQYDKLMELRTRLLTIGGEEVCMPDIEEDIECILLYGQLWTNKPKVMKGEKSTCHYNSSLLWEVNQKNVLIATGYGLSEDGMWRQHTWAIHIKPRSNVIIETTVPRVAYFGFAMSPEQCHKFHYNNI